MASFTAYASKMKAEGLSDAAIAAFNLLKQVVRLDLYSILLEGVVIFSARSQTVCKNYIHVYIV